MKRTLLLFSLLCFFLPPAWSQGTEAASRLDPLPEVLEVAAMAEPLDLDAFIRSALRFSGVGEDQLAEWETLLQAWIETLQAELAGVSDPRIRAEAVLSFMHREILERYDERQTDLDALLSAGTYNCVSSGVLYAVLAKSLDLRVWGVRTADHAFCRVQAGGEAFDVETTSPFGFDPGKRKEFTDDFGKVTGYSYVPPSNYRDRRDIGEKELLGLILFNRAAFASERREYLEAVAPAVDAYALLGDEESYERLITSLHNLASWYGMRSRFEDGLGFLRLAELRYSNDRLSALRADLIHNYAIQLIQAGDYRRAERVLDEYRGDGALEESQWRELTVYLYQVRAKKLGNHDAAARLILEGIDKVGSDQGLSRSYEVYIHNSVVTLAREERYEEALSVLEEALQLFPSSRVLLSDRSKVLEASGRQ